MMSTRVIISQYIQIPNHYVLHMKPIMLYVNYTSVLNRSPNGERPPGKDKIHQCFVVVVVVVVLHVIYFIFKISSETWYNRMALWTCETSSN